MTNPVDKLKNFYEVRNPIFQEIEILGKIVVDYYNTQRQKKGLITYEGWGFNWYYPDFDKGTAFINDDRGYGICSLKLDRDGFGCDSCFIPAECFSENYKKVVDNIIDTKLQEIKEEKEVEMLREKERLQGKSRVFRGELS